MNQVLARMWVAVLALSGVTAPAWGQEGSVLARVEAVDRVDRLGLPIYAHLMDADGKDYALVVAPESGLQAAGWSYTVLATEPDPATLAMVIERTQGAMARLQAQGQIRVLYDDGKRLFMQVPPDQFHAVVALGFSVIRISEPLTWPARLGLASDRRLTPPPTTISNLLALVDMNTASNYLSRLSGEEPVTIGTNVYTLLTRHAESGLSITNAEQYVYEHLEAQGLQVSFYNFNAGRNVVGVKLGSGAHSNEIVLVTAHLDSMPASARSPGADDNASGCVGLMIAADAFSSYTTDRTLRFVFCGAEEAGLLGSDAYAAACSNADDAVVAVFNMDMISYSTVGSRPLSLHTRTASSPGYAGDMLIASTFVGVVESYLPGRLAPVIASDSEPYSDHYSFWLRGYSAILAIESDDNFTPFYHTTNDLISSVNMEYCTDFIKASLGTVALLAGTPGTTPAPPAQVEASNGTFPDKVRVSWDAVAGATSYEVWRHTGNSTSLASKISSPNPVGTSYDDLGAATDTTYYYWVKALNAENASGFSASDRGFVGVVGPLVMANGQVGTVYVPAGDTTTIAVQMLNIDPYIGVDVDWWIVAFAHSGDWYCLNSAQQWPWFNGALALCQPAREGPLVTLPATPVLDGYSFSPGTYDFWFAVDYPMDGVLNPSGQILFNKVTVVVP